MIPFTNKPFLMTHIEAVSSGQPTYNMIGNQITTTGFYRAGYQGYFCYIAQGY
jgi:hypothetical protein